MQYLAHKYQQKAIDKIIDTPRCGMFLDMGLGKTVITLTAINHLMYEEFEISKVLVIAPLRVAEATWATEACKWDHTRHLRISKILGSTQQRRRALTIDADIYIINRENVVWLCNELSFVGGWCFDMVVIDELSSFKSAKAQRFKALRKYIGLAERIVGLTGTPAPNGLMDLWSELYLLDKGERLGRSLTAYREKYFNSKQITSNGIRIYRAKENSEAEIMERISDICMSMKAEDWLDMPQRIDNICYVELDEKEKAAYERFERDSYIEFKEGAVAAFTAASLTGKLLQFSNGAMYTADKSYIKTNSKKIDRLGEIIDDTGGKPILCFYSYKHDLERIKEKFGFARKLEGEDDIKDWNEGKITLLLAHPASAGHGLNLQQGGSIIVWFGLNWSLELYQQANARLYRQGQQQSVIIHHIIARDTADEIVMRALMEKKEVQDELIESLKFKYGGLGSHQ